MAKSTKKTSARKRTGGGKTVAQARAAGRKPASKPASGKKAGLAFDLRNAKNREQLKREREERAAARRKGTGTRARITDPQAHVVAKLEQALAAAKKKHYREVRSCIDSARRVAMAQPEYAKH